MPFSCHLNGKLFKFVRFTRIVFSLRKITTLVTPLTRNSVKYAYWRRTSALVVIANPVVKCLSHMESSATDRKGVKRKGDTSEEQPGKGGKRRRAGPGGESQKPGDRYVPPPQKRNPGVSFSQEHFQETTYYFEGGLRKVRPYYFDFKTYCKGRWVGKTLLEVFSTEFRAESLDFYRLAAALGRIRLNEMPVDDLNITLKNNDFLRNTVHRHEPPVSSRTLEILKDDGEVLVVDKPASLPVHPCGRFRHNTVIFILGKEHRLSSLHTVHRLVRLTSGVLLFARTLEVSKKLDQLVRDRQIEKEYLCRVEGEFPEGEIVCEEPILVVSFKVGVCRVDPKGKPCRTVFQRLSFNGHSSVVRCLPLTGRTHQIRVHLQYLGYPILNDPIYGSHAWGPQRAKGGLVGMSDEELLKALMEAHRSKQSLHLLDLPEEVLPMTKADDEGNTADPEAQTNSSPGACQLNYDQNTGDSMATQVQSESTVTKSTPLLVSNVEVLDLTCTETSSNAELLPSARDPLCSECKLVRADPTEKELVMYLHALCYKGPDFEYSTRMPDWAKEGWVDDKACIARDG